MLKLSVICLSVTVRVIMQVLGHLLAVLGVLAEDETAPGRMLIEKALYVRMHVRLGLYGEREVHRVPRTYRKHDGVARKQQCLDGIHHSQWC